MRNRCETADNGTISLHIAVRFCDRRRQKVTGDGAVCDLAHAQVPGEAWKPYNVGAAKPAIGPRGWNLETQMIDVK